MNFFEQAALRLKQELNVPNDKQAAELLGMSPRAWSGRKKTGSFPEKELRALAQQRPELGLDVDYILTGQRRPNLQQVIAGAAAQGVTAAELAGPHARLHAGAEATLPAPAQDEARLLAAFRACDSAHRTALLLVAQALAERARMNSPAA